jgi:hypothetical protein
MRWHGHKLQPGLFVSAGHGKYEPRPIQLSMEALKSELEIGT